MVITDQAQFEQLVQEVRDQILSESQGVGEVDIVDNLDSIYSLPALKLNDNGDQVVEAPLSLLSAPAEEAAALARAAAYDANTAAESANSAASSANLATNKTNEAISDAQSATQQAESSADKANTAAQNADEATAQVLSGESERVEAENARQAAETERQSAEEERKSAEEARKLAEQSREQAESSRVSAEESRVTAESERVTAESSRAQAETERVQKESERESVESTRQQNETTRQSNEDARVQQEQTRQTNEEQRVSAESSRETEYTDLKQRSDALIDDNEAAIENANTAAENANAAIANMENTYAKKDEIPDVSEFITISVDNLVNYYRKSETYNQEQINSLIGSITTINFKIVDSLPGTGESNLIYLVPSSKQEEKNVKDEYIWIDDSWELIGSTKIDLSNYYTKDEANSTFALKTELAWDTITGKPVWIGSSKPTYTWSEINEKPTTLAGYGITDAYTKTESDERYVTLSTEQTITGTKTFSRDNARVLFIKNSNESKSSDYVALTFYHEDNNVGSIVADNKGSALYRADPGFTTVYKLLDTSNYSTTLDTRYVKKSGDTMTGQLTINAPMNCILTINSRGEGTDSYPYFELQHDGIRQGVYSASGNQPYFYNNGWKKIWYSGNDGSGSGLDADLLDGRDSRDFGITTASYINTDQSATDTASTSLQDFLNRLSADGHLDYKFCFMRGSWYYVGNTQYNTGVGNLEMAGTSVLSLSHNTGSSLDYRTLLFITATGEMFSYVSEQPGFYHWSKYAKTTDNVASATKLRTTRTIWGQSFDGTRNVSGDMYNVGSINASGKIKTAVDGAAYYFGIDGHYIGANTERDFYIWGMGTNDFRIGTNNTERIRVTKNGDVGINTFYPFYKCHVEGTFYASGAATLGSDLTVNGDLTVKGTIIDSTSSDIRLKNILEQVDYQERLLSLGDVVDFNYNDTAFSKENSSNLEHRSYTGLIYQNVKEILPQMAHEDDDGYGYLNYLSHDYINLIAGALQQTITKQKQLEKRISILEEENINLKQQLSN